MADGDTTYDLNDLDASGYRIRMGQTVQLTLDATEADATAITLPTFLGGGYALTIGPIRTSAAEGTTEAGAYCFLVTGDTVTLPAFGGDSIATGVNNRRYLPSGGTVTVRIPGPDGAQPETLLVRGTSASAVVAIAVDDGAA